MGTNGRPIRLGLGFAYLLPREALTLYCPWNRDFRGSKTPTPLPSAGFFSFWRWEPRRLPISGDDGVDTRPPSNKNRALYARAW